MNVVGDLRKWLEEQPKWLTEALNRLLIKSNLDDKDITELTELCKRVHGLSEAEIPMSAEAEIEANETPHGPVNIKSVHHHKGVNALAENQKLEFAPTLTVVYGDNGAGKSGYTRILKQACKARGTEVILGNVFDPSKISKPKVSIEYTIGGDLGVVEDWEIEESPLHMVNVFDSHSASVYLNEKTDVAFRPFGLDLYDKLSNTCESVKRRLDAEISFIQSLQFKPPALPPNTKAAEFLSRITARTTREEFNEKIRLKPEEEVRLSTVEKMIEESRKQDKVKLKTQLEVRKRRIESLRTHLKQLDDSLSDASITSLYELNSQTQEAKKVVESLRNSTLDVSLLPGTGNDIWRPLWEAAKSFSENSGYPDSTFPNTAPGSKCVLCQQELSYQAKERFELFNELVQSVADNEYSRLKNEYSEALKSIDQLKVIDSDSERLLEDLRIESPELSRILEKEFISISKRRETTIEAVNANRAIDIATLPKFTTFEQELSQQAFGLQQRIESLEQEKSQIPPQILLEKSELLARQTLTQYESLIFDEVDRKLKLALYNFCLNDVKTTSITRKSSTVTKELVSQKLKDSFHDELKKMAFDHVDVEIIEAGGQRGTMYHKLILTRAHNIEVPKIASEGESRCLSIAAFFAELSTADDPSAILFDDPVSSLDHKWRTRIAHRLVSESQNRQVIVFTHDLVFLLELISNSEESDLPFQSLHLRREGLGAGIVVPDLPWKAMKVKARISTLNNDMQDARKQYKECNYSLYETLAKNIYGNLRETWERAVEEVLLNDSVQRYRKDIQTKRLSKLSDISEQDFKVLEQGMTKSSKWLSGHDLARAENEDIPNPDELEHDIKSLNDWVKNINDRRK